MSDIDEDDGFGSDHDIEASTTEKHETEHEDPPPAKKQKIEEVDADEMTFDRPESVPAQDAVSTELNVKTQNVKDFGNILLGCCAVPGVEVVIMTLTPEGMQLYAKPNESPTAVTVFWNKKMFIEYNVPKEVRRVMEKSRLEFLKKKTLTRARAETSDLDF